jgi:hypothetical protein
MSDEMWMRVCERIQLYFQYRNGDDLDRVVRLFQDTTINCDLVCDVADMIGIGTTCQTATCDRRRELLRSALEMSANEMRQRRIRQRAQQKQKERQDDLYMGL